MRLALGALWRRPARSIATSLGIGLASGLVLLLLALSAGIQSSATRLAASSGIDLLATSANTSLSSATFPPVTPAHLLPDRLHSADANIATASPWLVASLTFANASLYDRANRTAGGASVPPGWAPAAAGTVGWIPERNVGLAVPGTIRGPGFSSSTDRHYANGTYAGAESREVELDQGLAGLLHVAPGDLVWTSEQSISGPAGLSDWFSNATPFRVVGITASFWLLPSALLAFFYLSELQGLLGEGGAGQDYASLVLVHLTDRTEPARDQAALSVAFPTMTFFTIGNILGAVQDSVNLYRTFGTLVGVLGLVVATLFTATVLLMSVDDRSREFAVFRAIGFPRSKIGLLVLEEGLWLSAAGLGLGIAIGWIGAYALDRFLGTLVRGLPNGFSFVSFDLGVVAFGVAEVTVIGLLASFGPALRAMRLPVAQELRAP